MQKSTGGNGTTAHHHDSGRASRHNRSADYNPSMTVVQLSASQTDNTKPQQKTVAFRSSAGSSKQVPDDRRAYASLSALPSSGSIPSLTRSTSNHKLGTLRNSGVSATRLQPQRQREIALGALRSGDHWSTTYGNDYSKQFGLRR